MQVRRIIWGIIACLTFAVVIGENARKPNVVIIMADDLGYHDLGCYGHPSIKTPVLDKLAASGVRLTSFYSGATVCTPSRMALLTGAYPSRMGWSKGVIGYMMSTHHGLAPEARTMGEVFKAAGYATGLFGKWHLGDLPRFSPQQQGFSTSFYINKSNNQTTQLWRGNKVVKDPFDNRLLTEQFTKESIRFIHRHAHAPFLLYIPFSAPHFPVEAHPAFKATSSFGAYGDVVEEMDARIGEILSALTTAKLLENTIVVMLSDNGPQPGEQALSKPFRGKKWDALEAGTRVPCILSWPGTIPARQESDALIAAIDLLPTLSHACGIDLNQNSHGVPKIDGVNVWSTLTGDKAMTHPRNDLLYWHGAEGFQAIRVGHWKLFTDAHHAKLPGNPGGEALFHLVNDPGETENLLSSYPEKARVMRVMANQRLADIAKHSISLGK